LSWPGQGPHVRCTQVPAKTKGKHHHGWEEEIVVATPQNAKHLLFKLNGVPFFRSLQIFYFTSLIAKAIFTKNVS